MELWEEDEKKYLLGLYATGEYEKMLKRYCHEGYHILKYKNGEIEAMICSYSVRGIMSREEALREVAEHVVDRINNHDELGC